MTKAVRGLQARMDRHRLPVGIDEVYEGSEADLARARSLASLIKLEPTFARLNLDHAGEFALEPSALLRTTCGEDAEDLLDADDLFEGAVVRSPEQADAVATALEQRGRDRAWPFRSWLTEAAENGRSVLCVKEPGTPDPAGFVSYTRSVTVDIYEDSRLRIDYGIGVENVYVSRDCRGQRLSSALRRAIMADVFEDMVRLGKLVGSKRFEEFADVTMNVRVSGEAYSVEGNSFLDALRQNIEHTMEEEFAHDDLERLRCTTVEEDYSM